MRQDPLLGASEMFNSFLRKAQQVGSVMFFFFFFLSLQVHEATFCCINVVNRPARRKGVLSSNQKADAVISQLVITFGSVVHDVALFFLFVAVCGSVCACRGLCHLTCKSSCSE